MEEDYRRIAAELKQERPTRPRIGFKAVPKQKEE